MSRFDDYPDALDPWRERPITHLTLWPLLYPADLPAVATLARQRDDLTAHVARLEAENTRLRRQVARMRARIDGAPRKAPLWLLPFAYVGLAWGAFTGTYDHESEEKDR